MKVKRWLYRNRGFLGFLLVFGLFRTAVADWNPIPTGSMRPTILEGDVVLVNRLAYDLKIPLTNIIVAQTGDPQRGDIVTFESPKDGTRLIKRLVAVPGDSVEMRDDVLFINGQAAEYSALQSVRETLRRGQTVDATRATERIGGSRRRMQVLPQIQALRSFGPLTVPAGQYFMLGDNRDDSEDSRYIGFVERRRLIGRAERVLVSADITGHWMPRLERTASRLQ